MRWPALSHISADLTGLYQTALKQPMRRVDVVLDVIERHTVAWLTTVLTDMQPTHLQLQMDTSIERVQAFVPELLQAATRVKCFRLMVRSQYGIATSKIVSLLRPLSITELEIVDLSGHSLAYRPESLALSAASAVQSLEFVSVSISDRTQSFLITRSRIHGDITAELLDDMSSRSRREKNWS
ncbi:hypothetical protein CERSUDRAFT_111754 [Gelatoporia subvermispora B]|uniref:F-box domain-containing protein n=1 Tax=Ceriporiopsis subvermispora (strain B) TaxID=914234 RepID=M2QQW4_CERS8|nr:hypothetical protein CERSUDRAFT_111754 [Gelatoporia subvermispora B]